MEPLAADDPPKVGDYRLEGRLGLGGMGRVYLGRSPGGRPVAVKVVRPELAGDKGFRRRFAREVQAARAVNAFYTAPVIDADTEADPPWLVTAYVPGPSLRTAVEEDGSLPAEQIAALGAGLAEGLLAIHREGIVHRDLTPGNVILAGDGPRIVDFGIARALDATSPATTTGIIGTVAFMSPEQAKGAETGPPGDVFALACVLTYAATGRSPFGTGAPEAVLYRVVHGEPELDGVPGDVKDVIADCLRKEPQERPTMTQLLDRFTRSEGTTPPTGGPGVATEGAATAAMPDGGPTERIDPPPATRVQETRVQATRVQPVPSFTLTGGPSATRPGVWNLGAGAMLGLALGALAFVVCAAVTELPLDPENDDPGNYAIFLLGWPAAIALLGLMVDVVSPAPARYRVAGLVFGFGVGASIFMTIAASDGLDDRIPEAFAAPGLLFPFVIGPLTGLSLAKSRIRARFGDDADTRITSWYAHRTSGALIALILGIASAFGLDGEGPLRGTEPEYTVTLVFMLVGLTASGALLGLLAEPSASRRARSQLTVDEHGIGRVRLGGHGRALSVAWNDLDRVELEQGRVVGWFTDAPETARWAERNRLPLHAMAEAQGTVPPRVAYVLFDSGMRPNRPGEAGSLHRLDEALRAFGAGKYR